jgi:acetolactate synthase-1/2/3 large subunit
MTVATRSVAELLAGRLYDIGVRRAYGVPGGGSNLDLIDALRGCGIQWVLAHTEGGAAFMAAAEAEITGVPGLLIVGNGPGLASVVNGVAHAWLDRVPLLVISDRYTHEEARTTGHQVLDQLSLLAPIVRFGTTLEPQTAAESLERALAATIGPPRGPAHLDVPRDGAAAPADPLATLPAAGLTLPTASTEQGSLSSVLQGFAEELNTASRPVILVGLEAGDGTSPQDLTSIAHLAGAAVLTTYKGKGVYPEGDPRWGGVLTGGAIEAPLLDSADLLLTIGVDAVELLGRAWPYSARVLSITTHDSADAYFSPAVRCIGNLAEAVSHLAHMLADSSKRGFDEREIGSLRNAALDGLRLNRHEPLPAWRIVETVGEVLAPDATITVDAGAHMFPATMFARPSGPRRFLISNGLSTMGFAVPAAVGAALARPGTPSVAFTGDGGFLYHGSELETARRVGARIIVVVFNDASLSLIRIKHEVNGKSRDPFDFHRMSFDAFARAFGVGGICVSDADELREAVCDAVARPASTVIDARTTGNEYERALELIRG